MPSWEPHQVALAAATSAAAGAALYALLQKRHVVENEGALSTEDQRAKRSGVVARWTKPVVIAPPGLEELRKNLSKRLGCDEFPVEAGPTVLLESFKSGDPNMKFNWQRVVGRKIIFLFDTVDQSRLFEQLALLQALQGFAVPDSEDKDTKWKTYVDQGKYSWGRASHITVVLPWYRPCQMERTSRWHLADGNWTNGHPEGQWLDVPTAQYMARLLSTPGSVPPLPGPADSVDGMPISPLWRPPLELLFIELHEEVPISHSVSDLGATIRMERFVPYFLEKFKAASSYPGKADTFVLFPDHGAFNRYHVAVADKLKLDPDHILYINKTRVADSIQQEQKFCFEAGVDEDGKKKVGEKKAFVARNHVLIVDDFTNSGSTLFGAAKLVGELVEGQGTPSVSIFVSHLVATYSEQAVHEFLKKLHALGSEVRFFTTNTIPLTTNLIKSDPQVKVYDISDYVADLVHH